ncbi:MAG: transketolase [Gammaproteobacteria bacterium]|nr:transketolase [Gammaproteobacteria bacterium]
MSSRREKANAIRALAMDAVQQANSGHPGAPMGMADIAEALWTSVLRHNPTNPNWADRDRFVLSNGHGSMLLYSLLHLTGYDLSMEELRNFRQLGSKTPGHPEYGYAPGIETTTGPLGQGLANAVGMALAERVLASTFNQTDDTGHFHELVNHHTYVFAGDGCLMEGISHEVCSLAGNLGLGKLVCVYDDNGISIDGEVQGWFSDDTPARFEAYGWQVIAGIDGHDGEAVLEALNQARSNLSQPTLICCRTQIGFGSPNKAGTAGSHGAPLGVEEIKATRAQLGWASDPFEIPQTLLADWNCVEKGQRLEADWNDRLNAYQQQFPDLAKEYKRRIAGELPEDWAEQTASLLEQTQAAAESTASRTASCQVIGWLSARLPELIGGSADLSGSNNTIWPEAIPVSESPAGNYVYYGVREFGMTAMANGMALHGGLIPFTGTFLMFMEYARNAVRMSALMGIRNIHVYSHDSIGQGEDGPTHQPVEQLTNLRTTPGMRVWRPCDGVETVAAWCSAIERMSAPSALVLSRQKLAHQPRSSAQLAEVGRGGYILFEPDQAPQAVLIATGSEVEISHKAATRLTEQGIPTRLVSLPCAELFAEQDDSYQQAVLPLSLRCRVAVEAGHGDYWSKWVGLDGSVVSLDTFGESGPGAEVMAHFGFTDDNVVAAVQELVSRAGS